MMRAIIFTVLVFLFVSLAGFAKEIDKVEFYKAFSSGSQETIDGMIARLNQEKASPLTKAYQGALYMKKADFAKGAGNKVKTFKKGAKLLEEEIRNNASDAEYRFLRLAVQEHAPKILHYDKNLNEDKAAVVNGFTKFNTELKAIVVNYAKDSKVLKKEDLH